MVIIMDRTYNQELQSKVEKYINHNQISQAKAAQQMGVNAGFLSLFRTNKDYKGNIDEQESKLEEFFKLQTEQELVSEKSLPYRLIQSYVPTSISEDVYKLIRYCQIERGMVVIHGDAGIGKTKGAEKFARENPSSTIYIQATPSSGTLNSILKLIARALKIADTRSKLDLVYDIRQKLEGTNKIIIIDEAQHLKIAALEEIRTLSDPNTITGELGTGIVLIGNTEVYDRMLGKGQARFAQLFSRIRMNRYYGTNKVTEDDMLKLFPALINSKKEIEFLLGISHSKWGIRGAVNVYNNATNNEALSYDGLFGMARTMGIGVLN